MPQRDLLLPWLSAIDNAGLALRVHGVARPLARDQVAPWFERFGLGGFEEARPYELSGGMRQRVAFLRTLLAGKPVLALDEPFAALDAITRAEMQGWLARALEAEPRTVVLVTHDVEEAVLLGDRVVVLSPRPGRLVADLAVGVGRPRRRTDAAVVELRAKALEALAVPGMNRWLLPLLGVLMLLGIWELYVTISGVSSLVLPSPVDVARALVEDRGTLWHNLKPTAAEICLGMVLGAAFGLLVALALHFSGIVRQASYPLLVGSQAIPILILAPLLIVWLGFGLLPKLTVVALVTLLPDPRDDALGARGGRPGPDQAAAHVRRRSAGRRSGASSCRARFRGLLHGARIAAVFAVVAALLGEQAGSNSGLGYLLLVTVGNLETAEAFATVFVLAGFAILLFALLTLAERRALPWVHRQRDIQLR